MSRPPRVVVSVRLPSALVVGAGVALLCSASPAAAQQAIVRAEAQAQSLDCRGGDARVEGNHNRISFRGGCRTLEVYGNGNAVQAELAPGARVRVEGQDNRITYSPVRDGAPAPPPPSVVIAGVNTAVLPGTAVPPPRAEPSQPPVRPAPPAAAIPTNARPGPQPGAQAHSAARLPIPSASQLPAPAPPPEAPAEPLALRGDDQQRDADCAGRDALIAGNRGSYVLRGGCRSLRVVGDLATVRADLQPGARVLIEGSGISVHWRVSAPGNPPLVTIRGEASHAVRSSGGRLLP